VSGKRGRGDSVTEPDAILTAIEACLARQGSDGWAEVFVDLVARTGAAQVMVFAYSPEAATCLMSRNFRARALGATLSAAYLAEGFRQDPLYPVALGLVPGTLRRIDSDTVLAAMSPDYRARYYDGPGLSGKTAILAAGAGLRLAVNLYRARDGAPATPSPALETIIARLALAHFQTLTEPGFPAPLAVLSERERAVCIGILSGRKAEAIAADLGIAATTVVTYRTRAYQKLGITARGALFALCGR